MGLGGFCGIGKDTKGDLQKYTGRGETPEVVNVITFQRGAGRLSEAICPHGGPGFERMRK